MIGMMKDEEAVEQGEGGGDSCSSREPISKYIEEITQDWRVSGQLELQWLPTHTGIRVKAEQRQRKRPDLALTLTRP